MRIEFSRIWSSFLRSVTFVPEKWVISWPAQTQPTSQRTLRQVTESYILWFKFNFQRRNVFHLTNREKRHAPIRLATGENHRRHPAQFQVSYEDNTGANVDIR